MLSGYPPSHRNVDDPQPEICGLCGLEVGARHLVTAETEGLVGVRVCDVTPSCLRFRSRWSYNDRRRMNPQPTSAIGQSRVYEAGVRQWYDERSAWTWSTPSAYGGLVSWFRNDDIPYTSLAASWPVVYGLSPLATQTNASSQPAPQEDPFSSDYRGLRFGASKYLTHSTVTPTTAFTFVIALRTPAALSNQRLIMGASNGAIRVLSTGAVVLVVDGGASSTIAAAGTISTSTNYVLSVLRTSAGVTTVRRNGSSVGNGATQAGQAGFDTIGDSTGFGMEIDVAELMLFDEDHADDIAELEKTVSHLVGVSI